MQAIIDLLVSLRRHEATETASLGQMSPREQVALQTRLALIRTSIPKYVLDHYELRKRSETDLTDCPIALAMATLLSVYRALPAGKRQSIQSFFDLADYAPEIPPRTKKRSSSRLPQVSRGCRTSSRNGTSLFIKRIAHCE